MKVDLRIDGVVRKVTILALCEEPVPVSGHGATNVLQFPGS